jgi:hypothetical protein
MFKYTWRRFKFGAIASALILGGGYALAQTGGLGGIITSPVVVPGFFQFNGGPQASVVPANGGTFTCTSGGAITVANTNVTANSVFLFGLKTKGGTPASFNVTTVTPGTSFIVTCGTDTSVYNYIILG